MVRATNDRPSGFDIRNAARASVDAVRRRPIALLALGSLFLGLPLLLEHWIRHWLLVSVWGAAVWISFGLTSLIPFTGQLLLVPAIAALSSPRANGSVFSALAVLPRSAWVLLPYWMVNATPALLRIAQLAHSPTDLASPIWPAIADFDLVLNLLLVLTVAVYAPTAIIEGKRIVRSLARTLQLMRGGRWQILALYLLLGLVSVGAAFLAKALLASNELGNAALSVLRVIDAVVQLAWSVVVVASYKDLVGVCDGPPLDQTAEVFA